MNEWWEGDFSQLMDSSGSPITIYDPLTTGPDGTRDRFPENRIPQERFHPFGKTLKEITSRPNRNINPALGNNFEFFYPVVDDMNTSTIRIDHLIGNKDNLSVRWTGGTIHRHTAGGVFGNPRPGAPSYGSRREDAEVHNTSVNWNRSWSPAILNEPSCGSESVL
jgi:hypothetical protein